MNNTKLIACLTLLVTTAADAAGVASFTPRGLAPNPVQVRAAFDAPMVAFGDPSVLAPFDIDCPVPGEGRWADTRHFVYDFAETVPAGVACEFALREGLVSLDGEAVGGGSFRFHTGGPRVAHALPWEGDSSIDESQVFLLGLDAPVAIEEITDKVFCEIDGIAEKVPVEAVDEEVTQRLLAEKEDFLDVYRNALTDYGRRALSMATTDALLAGDDEARFEALTGMRPSPIVALTCKRTLPPDTGVALVWDRGIESVTGIANESPQRLAYRTREEFRARFHCRRTNADAGCNPVLPMSVSFTAPITRADAERISLDTGAGEPIRPDLASDDGDFVQSVGFPGPFAENTRFTLEVPDELRDDAGRALANVERFPLEVTTDAYAPLIKFAAEFGIIEHTDDAALPVTLRNVESVVPLDPGQAVDAPWQRRWFSRFRETLWPKPAEVNGRTLRIDDPVAAYEWLARLRDSRREQGHYDQAKSSWVVDSRPGERSLFDESDATSSFTLPKPGGARPMEVIGIPLERPGFYLVEIASPRLGAALYAEAVPYHAQTAALVTNLAAHFKHGRESSLVWVTTLDTAQPVAGADVVVSDCNGKTLFEGTTDRDGVARVARSLPALPDRCSDYIVSARDGGDMTFTLSSWDDGIEPWRFDLPYASWTSPNLVSAVFDRPLYGDGETVHMKLFARRHGRLGFRMMPADALPPRIDVVHEGSGTRYEVPVAFDDHATALAEWRIPGNARAGRYRVEVEVADEARGLQTVGAGDFRIDEFKVPTMNAVIAPVAGDLVRPDRAEVDIQLNYLSGGGAGNASVRLRGMLRDRDVRFDDYEAFTFANGNVAEGRETDDGDGAAAEVLGTRSLTLDPQGGAREAFSDLVVDDTPRDLVAEVEYADANGEILTRSTRMTLWPSAVVLGIKPDGWAVSRDRVALKVQALDIHGRPLPGARVVVDALKRTVYSHRKRLVGGFYAYESVREVESLGTLCEGETDALGLLECEAMAPDDGNLVLRARAEDADGNPSFAHRDVWVAGEGDWWFEVGNEDRMDVLPEGRRVEPGETARLQVRMPFREATALVTLEREGVIDAFVRRLSGERPIVDVPIASGHAPNVFVSVLAVRGRTSDSTPTALVDLDKPAYRLGFAELEVGWGGHRLDVDVEPDRRTYDTRDTSRVRIRVGAPGGALLPPGAEVAVAAVDEGLLELLPNTSWDLLASMMGRRGIEVTTATAQMQVVGKRHYGKKAVPAGGGGGRQTTRELFDTLLFWKGRVSLDARGEASVEIPLNDSLTAFRIVAVAHAGAGLFGAGGATIRATRDVMVIPGAPRIARQGDRFRLTATVRNTAGDGAPRDVAVAAELTGNGADAVLPEQTFRLAAGEAREIGWDIAVVDGAETIGYTIQASAGGRVVDRVASDIAIEPVVPVRVQQAMLGRVADEVDFEAAPPAGALPGRGGLRITLTPSLADQVEGVLDYMRDYPYTCLEQRVSRAAALGDDALRDAVLNALPGYLDGSGLARFWPSLRRGDDSLTAYVLAIADAAGWAIPAAAREPMLNALAAFLDGRLAPEPTGYAADLPLRRLAAMAALSRYRPVDPGWLTAMSIEPERWPTSALLDWIGVLSRSAELERRGERLDEAVGILKSRLYFNGTALSFSTERGDALWWLMASPDVNANRAILALMDAGSMDQDVAPLVLGSLGRRSRGHWSTTPANAWGMIAMKAFASRFEAEAVNGETAVAFGERRHWSWRDQPEGGSMTLPWSETEARVSLAHRGDGRPWYGAESLAAVPLGEEVSRGYSVRRSVTVVSRADPGGWSRGDVARVTIEFDAKTDMGWVVVDDPVPAGATVLGGGFRTESEVLAVDESRPSLAPAYEERAFDAYRAYFRFVPAGKWSVSYLVRYNAAGQFALPPTRVEAMYAPATYGETPNSPVEIGQ